MSESTYSVSGIEVLMLPANPLDQCDPPVAPYAPGVRTIAAGSVLADGAWPVPVDIEVLEDEAIPLRDGTVLYGDVYRPQNAGPLPAILIYTPYVKRGGWWNTSHAATNFGVPAEHLSGLQAFESLDPAYWCEHGYALVVVDARGTGHSGGDMVFMGTAAGRDVYDTVEWIAQQSWSTGKVAMAGNSQLAMVQWAAAAQRPPHLTAIAPWEGLTDVFRDVINRGGIPDVTFHEEDIIAHLYGNGRFEDVSAMLDRYPTDNAYWADKRADLSVIDVPTYVVSSWTNPIHTRNTQKAFQELASDQKWLRVHNTMEWVDIATPENIEDLRRFFDYFLKGEDNGWPDTPRVRYSVLDLADNDVHRTAETWPPTPTVATVLHLDATSGRLSPRAPETEASISYSATDPEASAVFRYVMDEETELLGPINVRLWVETSEGSDLDLFAALYKLDSAGKVAYHYPFRALKEIALALSEAGQLNNALAYTGPLGRLRVSHRALDRDKSTPLEPYLSHAGEEFVEPGKPVLVELGLWPAGLRFYPGETVVLEIAGHVAGPLGPPRTDMGADPVPLPTSNVGTHTIRTGGRFTSAAYLPFVK